MRPVLVGSRAARLHFADYRSPKDWDFFSPEKIRDESERVETFYHPALEAYDWSRGYATPNELYTIKVSHSFWNNRWAKHIQDVAFFQRKGCEVIPELYDILYPIWVEHYGAKRAKLRAGTKPEEFFTSTVKRMYDHDSIHHSIAYGDRPLFEKILRDGEAVAVDKSKFDALSYEEKCNLLREEVYATALERILIPSNYQESQLKAYRWALEKTVTSFSKGFWPKWIVLNINDLLRPDVDYVARHTDNANRLILLGE